MALKEEDLQIAIISWSKTQFKKHPELYWLFHCPNGGRRDGREATSLKMQGVVPGVVDLHLDVARGGYNGFKLELKRPFGKCLPPSKDQADYIDFCRKQGYFADISNDFEYCKTLILDYLEGRLVR